MSAAAARRVLVVLHDPSLGGATLAVLRCVPGLRERGWEFSFWVPPGPAHDELAARGERVAGVPRPHAYSLSALRLPPGAAARLRRMPSYRAALRERIRSEAPAVVHANSHTTLADAIIARGAGIPTLIHIHEMFGDGVKWNVGRRLVFRYGTEVVAVSEACAQALASGSRRALVIRNGVDLPVEVSSGSGGGGFVVGTVAAIGRRKGIDVLVEAARIVRERDRGIEFELIGNAATEPLDADWSRGVLAEARAVGISHTERADVPAALDRWDAFVLPSRIDPFPLSMLEAMAMGLPVIGAAVDGIPEQVAPATGILVEPGDPVALAEAILALRDRPASERRALGQAARERVAAEFTIEGQVEAMHRAYLAAIGAQAGGAGS
jgi:glycosyltransferase involved in cell wall biosynthesis